VDVLSHDSRLRTSGKISTVPYSMVAEARDFHVQSGQAGRDPSAVLRYRRYEIGIAEENLREAKSGASTSRTYLF